MRERARELVEEAKTMCNEESLVEAGNLYTAAAHEYQGTVVGHGFPEPGATPATVNRLCHAATCYRIAGANSPVQNRCDLGILLAEEYVKYIDSVDFEDRSFADLRRGAWLECIGDLRTIAGRDDAEEAYDEAASIYESAGHWEFCMAEQEHMRLAGFFKSVRRGLGHEIPDDALEQRPLGPTFSEWIEYKRERLPDLLDELETQGEWPLDKS
jgi:hypothetical protein